MTKEQLWDKSLTILQRETNSFKEESRLRDDVVESMIEMWYTALDEILSNCGHVGYDVTGDSVNGISKEDLTEIKNNSL